MNLAWHIGGIVWFTGLEPVERPTDPGNDAAFNIFFCFTNS